MYGEHPVASLLLDEANPRFDVEAASQREAANKILAESPQKLLRLAEDIASETSINPTELPVIVEEDGDLVVIEGNRRLAALKLLRKPDLADDPDVQKRFAKVAETGVGPESVFCYKAENRATARHWLELRHTGENDGIGVVPWETWQSNNFRRRPGSQADRANIFCAAIETDFPDEADLLADVAKVRRERLTTLGRLVGDPDVRQNFGFDFAEDGIEFHYDREDIREGIIKIFQDLAGNLGVTQIKSKAHRAEYIRKAAEALVLPPRGLRREAPRQPGIADVGGGSTPAPGTPAAPDGTGTGGSTRRTMPREENVIFKGLRLRKVGPRVSRFLEQAQKVDIETAPAVAAVALRVVIELTVTDAVVRLGVGKESDYLRTKIRAVLKQLDPDIENPRKRDKTLDAIWTRSQDQSTGVAVQAIHAFVHNVMAQPTPGEVREYSRTFRVLLERTDDLLDGVPQL
jgi:hypothetical protein